VLWTPRDAVILGAGWPGRQVGNESGCHTRRVYVACGEPCRTMGTFLFPFLCHSWSCPRRDCFSSRIDGHHGLMFPFLSVPISSGLSQRRGLPRPQRHSAAFLPLASGPPFSGGTSRESNRRLINHSASVPWPASQLLNPGGTAPPADTLRPRCTGLGPPRHVPRHGSRQSA
jgi:hypothetical protein